MANISATDGKAELGSGRIEYRLYMAIVFPVSFVGVVISRLFSIGRSRKAAHTSVLREAVSASHAVIPWIFSGR